MSGKLVFREIALNAKPFFAVFVEDENGRRPQDFKSVELRGLLFDVDGGGGEVVVDVLRQLRVAVRFGLQPNASPSSGSGAEIQQRGTMFRLCLAECGACFLQRVLHPCCEFVYCLQLGGWHAWLKPHVWVLAGVE